MACANKRTKIIAIMRSHLAAVGVLFLAVSVGLAQPAQKQKPPNILFILADDLGYGDVGVTYQNSRSATQPSFATPHLDRLAKSGVILRQHYTSAPVCAPARASLLSGQSQGHCAVRDNQFDKALPDELNLASMLKLAGYHTIAIGKWGLAGPANKDWPAHPNKRGFDEFFGFVRHGDGHVYYHDEKHPLHENLADVTDSYRDIYSTDLFTARAKKAIAEQKGNEPWFMYLAYTAVHNALQVPGKAYPPGAGANGGLQWPLKPTPQTRDQWIHPAYANKAGWTDAMKRYATMARRLDDGVGDILKLLDDLHLRENTLVIFTSDNGPANEGGSDPRLFDSWGPFDGFKRDCWEGGVREPTFVSWPGQIAPGRRDDTPSAFWDWMPTLAEAAGLPAPAHSDGISLLPMLLGTGRHEHPYLYFEYFHETDRVQPASKDVFARKHVAGRNQQQLVRIGDYVGIRTDIKSASDPLRLYNVMTDPHEDHDLAGDLSHRDLLKRMNELLVTARRPEPSTPRPYDHMPMPDVGHHLGEIGLLGCSVFNGSFPYTPDFAGRNPTSSTATPGFVLPKDIPTGPFGLRFSGFITVAMDGDYTFNVASDGPVHFWLHDAHLIDREHGSSDRPAKTVAHLAKGTHPMQLYYLHGANGKPELMVQYSGPNLPEQPIPPQVLE